MGKIFSRLAGCALPQSQDSPNRALGPETTHLPEPSKIIHSARQLKFLDFYGASGANLDAMGSQRSNQSSYACGVYVLFEAGD